MIFRRSGSAYQTQIARMLNTCRYVALKIIQGHNHTGVRTYADDFSYKADTAVLNRNYGHIFPYSVFASLVYGNTCVQIIRITSDNACGIVFVVVFLRKIEQFV